MANKIVKKDEIGTTVCRVYNTTMEKINRSKGLLSIGAFIDEAVNEYIRTTENKGLTDRMASIENGMSRVELSCQTSLGLLVNVLNKLKLTDGKDKK